MEKFGFFLIFASRRRDTKNFVAKQCPIVIEKINNGIPLLAACNYCFMHTLQEETPDSDTFLPDWAAGLPIWDFVHGGIVLLGILHNIAIKQ